MGKVRTQTIRDHPILIRPARVGEADAIVALIHRPFAQYRGNLEPESGALSESADKIASVIAGGIVLAAELAGRVVGCVAVEYKADFVYVGRLAVDPAVRGTGIGQSLIKEAEAVARRLSGRRLRVDVRLALAENRAFFRALGFVEGAHRCHPGFTVPTYVELEKTLI
ncbi:MAG: GNAT family N-acetyltransferase [Dongiaceae bacterium]